jgi:hypothetical protein
MCNSTSLLERDLCLGLFARHYQLQGFMCLAGHEHFELRKLRELMCDRLCLRVGRLHMPGRVLLLRGSMRPNDERPQSLRQV